MTPPRITLIVGGRWHAFDLALGLKHRGALHRLVTNYPWSKVRNWGFERTEVACIPWSQLVNQFVQRCVPERHKARFQHFTHSWFARDAVRHLGGAELVHGWSSFSLPSIEQCRWRGVPFVLERGSSHMRAQCDLLRQERARLGFCWESTHPKVVAMELAEYESALRIVVPSKFVERTFVAHGIPAERLCRNTLGVDLSLFRPRNENKRSQEFTAIFAGALSFRKGVHYLVEGFRQAAIPNSKLVLVGGACGETDRLIGKPPPGLVRLGHVPQSALVEHYRRAHVFVIASIEEGLAMVQAQALACGLPLVCTENTGGEDLLQIIDQGRAPVVESSGIRRYSAGFVVSIRSPAVIATCLRRLREDPFLWESQSRCALRIHACPLSWQDYSDRALAGYEALLGRRYGATAY